jgi:hypothetical protein
MSELSVGQLKGLLANNNVITVPSGHTLYAPGSVIQVVNVENTTRTTQTFTNGVILDIAGLSATITPKKATSKIVIQARWFGEFGASPVTWDSMFGLSRNGTQVGRQTDGIGATNINGITMSSLSYYVADASSTPEVMSYFVSDSPNSTSAVTYQVTFIASSGGTLFTNRTVGWTPGLGGHELGVSSIMLMEIAQ